jgi:hypothetical protein
MKRCILLVITIYFFSCTKDDPAPVTDSTIHLAGFVTTSSGSPVASYWKDGVYNDLTNNSIYSNVSSLSVDGSLVLIGGSRTAVNASPPAVIWQDGEEIILDNAFGHPMIVSRDNNLFGVWIEGAHWIFNKNGASQQIIDSAYDYAPMALAVSGDDVYISGYSSDPPSSPTYSPPQHAQYWKNGVLIFREVEASNGLSIVVNDNDVFMAGHRYTSGQHSGIACYWKNGERVDLTSDDQIAVARSVFVTDGHIYVAGMLDDQAVYWKDGEVIALTTSGTNSMANSIVVQGTDVHVAGYENGHPAYWKNNVKQNIENHDKPGQIKFVVVGSN